jgi:hypothetical protein
MRHNPWRRSFRKDECFAAALKLALVIAAVSMSGLRVTPTIGATTWDKGEKRRSEFGLRRSADRREPVGGEHYLDAICDARR